MTETQAECEKNHPNSYFCGLINCPGEIAHLEQYQPRLENLRQALIRYTKHHRGPEYARYHNMGDPASIDRTMARTRDTMTRLIPAQKNLAEAIQSPGSQP